MDSEHVPVLLKEVIAYLCMDSYSIFVDATLGPGGHAYYILTTLKNVTLIGMDVDEEALISAEKRLKKFGERVFLFRENYVNMGSIFEKMGIGKVDAVLFDLGLSTLQLKSNRGFSFTDEAFLDMRMDKRATKTAYDVVNSYAYKDLLRVIRDLGEEEEAERIAKAIIEERKKGPIQSARELASIVERAKRKKGRLHPATKTFQAIRIEVNNELSNLQSGLEKAATFLGPGGRMGVISFHSLEDRIVKQFVRRSPFLQPLTKSALRPSPQEVRVNRSSRSAKFRVAEKRDAV